jgi:hypothetical protein
MNLRPWKLWTPDGQPAEGTEEIVATLEGVLRRDSKHTGANHYLIHAVEASSNPQRALESAKALETLAPAAGHLVHMPAHIYMRTGDYYRASLANIRGADADVAYIKATGTAQTMYSAMYYSHNLHFLSVSASAEGRFGESKKAADQVRERALPFAKKMPMAEAFVPTPILILARFGKWNDLLNLPQPDQDMPVTTVIWRFGRGMAFAARGKAKQAGAERDALKESIGAIPGDASFGLNKAGDVFKVAATLLDGKIAWAKADRAGAVAAFRDAVRAEDALAYDEPPGWFLHVRETLGAALLQSGDAASAEAVFREELKLRPRSARALFGLRGALTAQRKQTEAARVDNEYRSAWKRADTKLRMKDF